jgi:hypothetical protein
LLVDITSKRPGQERLDLHLIWQTVRHKDNFDRPKNGTRTDKFFYRRAMEFRDFTLTFAVLNFGS